MSHGKTGSVATSLPGMHRFQYPFNLHKARRSTWDYNDNNNNNDNNDDNNNNNNNNNTNNNNTW